MRAFRLTFVLITIVLQSAFAQNYHYIDSLNKVLKNSEGIARADIYLQIAWEYRKSHPDSTIYYAERASDLAQQLGNNDRIITQSLNFKGVAYQYLGDNLKSFELYNKAMDQALLNNDSVQYAHSLNSLGRNYMNQGDFVKAYDYYFRSLEIFEAYNDLEGMGYSYKSLAELYQTQENYNKALEMSEKTLKIRLENDNIHGQISILMEIAYIHRALKNFDKSFDFYLQAKIKAESIDDQINIANTNLGISELYYDDAKYDESLIFASKAYDVAEETQNMALLSQILLQMGKIHFQIGNYDKSISFLEKTLVSAEKSQELALLRDAYFFSAEIYKQRNDFNQAYDNYVAYAKLDKRLSNTEVARTIERFESRLEVEKRDRQNELLVANQARDQAIIERQRIQNIALLVVIVVVIILGLNLFITNRKRKQANLRLHEKNTRIAMQREEITAQNDQIGEQNKKLKRRNEELAEINNEKNTLMNIVAHDLKSPFNRIKGLVELLNLSGPNEEQKNYISLLKDITNGGVDLIRDLLDVNAFEDQKRVPEIRKIDLHNLLLEKTNLFYADAKAKGIEIINHDMDDHLIYESDEIYLSRILDNLISNAIKFSEDNSKVKLDAGTEDNYIYISVQDQGPGFSEDDKKYLYTKFKKLSARPTAGESSNGLGLAIVKTLVDRLGGVIHLDSKPKEGSTFTIKFPIKVEEVSASK